MNKICIRGAKTLRAFTEEISRGFKECGVEVVENLPVQTLTQIHGSPSSEEEDVQLLKRAADVYLVHRPDEILLRPALKNFFADHPQKQIVLMGDLVMSDSFWQARKEFVTVIPHPFMDLSLPEKRNGKYVMGAFTGWGELRDPEHFIRLTEAVKKVSDQISFMAGGTGLGKLPPYIQLAHEPFVPHFNVQLYHLEGKKRLGESSGSLHRGISLPVIFEANNAERIENLKVIKVKADSGLTDIAYDIAAGEIGALLETGIDDSLKHNLLSAQKNTPAAFARKMINLLNRT